MLNEEPMHSIVDLVLVSCELTEDEFEVDDMVADALSRSSLRPHRPGRPIRLVAVRRNAMASTQAA